MTWWRGLRWSRSWLFGPLILVAAFAGSASERAFFGDYPLVAISQAWVCLVVVAPLMACWAAWDAGRVRPWLDRGFTGTQHLKALSRILGLAVGATILGVTTLVALVAGRPVDALSWVVTLVGVMALVVSTLWGALLGMAVPRLLAAPIATVTSYALMAVAVADPASGLGRIVATGVVAPCCNSTEQISWPALAGTVAAEVVVSAGLILTLSTGSGTRVRMIGLGGSLTIAASVVAALAAALGPGNSLAPRTTQTVCADGDRTRACVWPEHAGDLPNVLALLEDGNATLAEAGLTVPTLWSEDPSALGSAFLWNSGLADAEHRYALAVDMAHAAGCTRPEDEIKAAGLLALRLGVEPEPLVTRNPETSELVSEYTAGNDSGRLEQFSRQLRSCQK